MRWERSKTASVDRCRQGRALRSLRLAAPERALGPSSTGCPCKGSSNRRAGGLRTMARLMATRWRLPAESPRGSRSSRFSSPRIDAASATRALISALGAPASRSEKLLLAASLMFG